MSRERHDKETLNENQDLESSKVVDESKEAGTAEVDENMHENQINGNGFTLDISRRV